MLTLNAGLHKVFLHFLNFHVPDESTIQSSMQY